MNSSNWAPPFVGNGGFMAGDLTGWSMGSLPRSVPIYRGINFDEKPGEELLARVQSGEDLGRLIADIVARQNLMERGITSATSNLPIRENLEAPASLLIPLDTPVRNRIPRTIGSGSATAWRQITSLGGGYGISTTVTSGASSATQTVGSTAGMQAGDVLYFETTNAERIVSSVTNATTVVLTATISTTTSEVVTFAQGQPGSGATARSFFTESGAPADHTTTYAAKSLSYKLLGTYGSITGFAMAAGANFQDQRGTEMTNAIYNLMLNEENALINGSLTDTASPWGDGSTAMAFNGLRNLITTANGVPTPQVQTGVGALTFAHMDAQLRRQWTQGAQGRWILCSAQEALSIAHLFDASGSTNRVMFSGNPADLIAGRQVRGYVCPVSGEVVPVIVSRFVPPGTMLFCADRLPSGQPALDVNVLPQVQLPQLAPNAQIQGYVAQELAPTTSAPQVYPFIVTVYEVLRMKAATVFAKSTGLTAV